MAPKIFFTPAFVLEGVILNSHLTFKYDFKWNSAHC